MDRVYNITYIYIYIYIYIYRVYVDSHSLDQLALASKRTASLYNIKVANKVRPTTGHNGCLMMMMMNINYILFGNHRYNQSRVCVCLDSLGHDSLLLLFVQLNS